MKKTLIRISIIAYIVLLLVGLTDLLKKIYIEVNSTETTVQIVDVKETIESRARGKVFKILVRFNTKEKEIVTTSFKVSVGVYDTTYYSKGNIITIKYSNWTPKMCYE